MNRGHRPEDREASEARRSACQWFTPTWLAEAIVARHFHWLSASDFAVEPTCGNGSFLRAIPGHVPALGVEADPDLASIAADDSGRSVICGDVLAIELPQVPTVFLGNPPFRVPFISALLERCHALLPEGGRAGFLLPAYALSASRRVTELRDRWSIRVELVPRDVFPRMRESVVFALFRKDAARRLIGLALVDESADVLALPREYRQLLQASSGGRYRALCVAALRRLGGRASLKQIYGELERVRPSRTAFWRDGIRRTLRAYDDFVPLGVGQFGLRNRVFAAGLVERNI